MIAQISNDWIAAFARWLTPRRLRAQAVILALCLWGVCAIDYATPGVFDRAGNIKFQDFLQFPVAARLLTEGRAAELYDPQVLVDAVRAIAGDRTKIRLQYFYGPQVALPFIPLVRFPFLAQAGIWVALSLFIYFGCVYLTWKTCPGLRSYPGLVAVCALAYPPLFHFFVRGQISALMLLCFSAAYLALHKGHHWLAGIALGFLALKPQFLVALPLVLLLAQAWNVFAGLALSAAAQLAFTAIYFGRAVMADYFRMLLHSAGQPSTTELSLSPIQMHSLRSFWALLIPWPSAVWVFYGLSSLVVIGIAAAVWKSPLPLSVRFSSLILAAVLVNPHLYIYDLLALAPALLLVAGWSLANPKHPSAPALRVSVYFSFLLPLFGPLSRWTHVQLSVPVFTVLLCLLWRVSTSTFVSRSHKLASSESAVV